MKICIETNGARINIELDPPANKKSDKVNFLVDGKKVNNNDTENKPRKRGIATTKECAVCGVSFTPTSNVQKYCSPNCKENSKKKVS